MFYISLFLIFLIGGLIQLFTRYSMKFLFLVLSLCLLLVTCFRYGIGTDYFSYQYQYNLIPSEIYTMLESDSHMDIGFRILMFICRSYNFEYHVFTGFIALLTLLPYLIIIKENSKKPITSLFLLYSLYWLVYINSALRQGLAMSIFIFAFYDFVNTKNTIRYVLTILLASLIHKVALIGLLVVVIHKFYQRLFNNKKINILLIFVSLFLFLIKGDVIVSYLLSLIGINIVYQSTQANILAIILRVVNVILIYFLYRNISHIQKTESMKFQIYVYFISVLIFIATSNMPIISRATDFLMIIEIILFPNLLSYLRIRFDKLVLVGVIITISGVLFLKDMGADLSQGNYYNKDILQYPYISFLNREDIIKYKSIKIGIID